MAVHRLDYPLGSLFKNTFLLCIFLSVLQCLLTVWLPHSYVISGIPASYRLLWKNRTGYLLLSRDNAVLGCSFWLVQWDRHRLTSCCGFTKVHRKQLTQELAAHLPPSRLTPRHLAQVHNWSLAGKQLGVYWSDMRSSCLSFTSQDTWTQKVSRNTNVFWWLLLLYTLVYGDARY